MRAANFKALFGEQFKELAVFLKCAVEVNGKLRVSLSFSGTNELGYRQIQHVLKGHIFLFGNQLEISEVVRAD